MSNTDLQTVNPGRNDIPLTRIYLPFVMMLGFGGFLLVAGYTVGTVLSGITRDKSETDARLASIEKEVTAIKSILSERSLAPPTQVRCK